MRRALLSFMFGFILVLLPFGEAGNAADVHRIDVLDLFLSDKALDCSTMIYPVVELRNSGTQTEYAHVEISNPELKIDEFGPIFQILPGRLGTVTIPLTFDKEPEGTHEFEIIVYFSNEVKHSFKSFTFKGCAQLEQAPPQSNSLASNPPPKEQDTSSFNTQVFFIVIMVLVIFLLALIYLLKLYIENITRKEQ